MRLILKIISAKWILNKPYNKDVLIYDKKSSDFASLFFKKKSCEFLCVSGQRERRQQQHQPRGLHQGALVGQKSVGLRAPRLALARRGLHFGGAPRMCGRRARRDALTVAQTCALEQGEGAQLRRRAPDALA